MYKYIIQLSLILIICILSYIFFNQSKTKKIIKNNISSAIEKKQTGNVEPIEKKKNEIEKLSYFSEDFRGNQYNIIAKSASSKTQKNENTFLVGVTAEINFINKDKFLINSNFAEYNQSNNNTIFKGEVNIIYSIYKMNSQVVNLDFEQNLIEIYENVVFKSINNKLYADKVIIDMNNKNLKILMKDKKDNILITGNISK
jgi:lipopolysaccharide assembly outer membrane protein LptD (OstA)